MSGLLRRIEEILEKLCLGDPNYRQHLRNCLVAIENTYERMYRFAQNVNDRPSRNELANACGQVCSRLKQMLDDRSAEVPADARLAYVEVTKHCGTIKNWIENYRDINFTKDTQPTVDQVTAEATQTVNSLKVAIDRIADDARSFTEVFRNLFSRFFNFVSSHVQFYAMSAVQAATRRIKF